MKQLWRNGLAFDRLITPTLKVAGSNSVELFYVHSAAFRLEKKNADLSAALQESEKESTVKKLQEMRLHSDYERIKGILERIPPDVIREYTHRSTQKHDINR